MQQVKKYIRPVLYILFFLVVALYLGRDFKEEGFYIEQDGEIRFLGEPYGAEARTLENLSKTINQVDGDFVLYFRFADFSPQSLHLYSTTLWDFREGANFFPTENYEDYHLSIQEKNSKVHYIHSRNLPAGNLVGLAYQQPNKVKLSLIGKADFDTLIVDSLEYDSERQGRFDFAKEIVKQYPHKPELSKKAETLLSNLQNQSEQQVFRQAMNATGSKRKRLLEDFVKKYPRSKYASEAKFELNSTSIDRLRRKSSKNKGTTPRISRSYLRSLIQNYVSSVNTRDYDSARDYVTGNERSKLGSYKRNKKVLDSRRYTHYDVQATRAYFYYDDNKSTQFRKVNGEWKISNF